MKKVSSEQKMPASNGGQAKRRGGAKSYPPPKTREPVRSRKPLPAAALSGAADPSAQRRAAAILEVLAGERTAAEAARLLGISAMHYYLLERRALQGLVGACAPRPKGPAGPQPEQELTRLRRELDRSRRECLRQAALVRATQRAIGFPAAAAASAKDKPKPVDGKRARRRRPTVRALRAAQTLRQNSSGPEMAEVVKHLPSEGTGLLGSLSAERGTAAGRSGKSQEPADDTPGQEAVGHGPCEASDGFGFGQAAIESAAPDATE